MVVFLRLDFLTAQTRPAPRDSEWLNRFQSLSVLSFCRVLSLCAVAGAPEWKKSVQQRCCQIMVEEARGNRRVIRTVHEGVGVSLRWIRSAVVASRLNNPSSHFGIPFRTPAELGRCEGCTEGAREGEEKRSLLLNGFAIPTHSDCRPVSVWAGCCTFMRATRLLINASDKSEEQHASETKRSEDTRYAHERPWRRTCAAGFAGEVSE